jgi:hypothetical protein
MLRQLWKILSMRRTIQRHAFELAISVTFIGVEESV